MRSSEVQALFDEKIEKKNGNFIGAIKLLEEMIIAGELDLISVLIWWNWLCRQQRS